MMETMTSENYVGNVLRTEQRNMEPVRARATDNNTLRLLHAALGMVTEAGEFADIIKKHIFYGKSIDILHASEEVGDQLWYVGVAVDVLQTTMDEVMTGNIAKLRSRYPEKFTEQHAVERDTKAERDAMKDG